MDAEKAVVQVLFPFLEKIGLLWQIGSIIPAHEHFVSNLIRNKLISETDKLPITRESTTILLFLKEEEQHEISLLFYNYLVRKNGYNTIYLGSNVPTPDLIEISGKYDFDLVLTVFVNAISKESLTEYLKQLPSIFINKQIFVSGLQFRNNKPEMPSEITLIDKPEGFVSILKMQ